MLADSKTAFWRLRGERHRGLGDSLSPSDRGTTNPQPNGRELLAIHRATQNMDTGVCIC